MYHSNHYKLYSNLHPDCFQKAKKKKIDKKSASDLGVDLAPRHEVISVEEPPVRQAGEKVEDVSSLVEKLKASGCI